jgi:hypothetical protein
MDMDAGTFLAMKMLEGSMALLKAEGFVFTAKLL